MPDINDPNGARDPIPVTVREIESTGYGWMPIAIVAALIMAIMLMLPLTMTDDGTRTVNNQNTQGPVKTVPPPQ